MKLKPEHEVTNIENGFSSRACSFFINAPKVLSPRKEQLPCDIDLISKRSSENWSCAPMIPVVGMVESGSRDWQS